MVRKIIFYAVFDIHNAMIGMPERIPDSAHDWGNSGF
jgi:hypothetical protein